MNDQNTDIVFANHLKWHSDGMKRVFNIIMSNMVVCQKQQQNVFKMNLFYLFIEVSPVLEKCCDI